MKFAITKRIDLSKVGENWDGAYIVLRVMSWPELLSFVDDRKAVEQADNKALAEYTLARVKQQFVEGKCLAYNKDNKAELVEVKAADLEGLPGDIINMLIAEVGRSRDPKESSPSGTSSTPEATDPPKTS